MTRAPPDHGIAGVQGIGSGAENPGLYAANSSGAQLYLQPMSSNTLPPANTGSLVVLANGQLNYCYVPSAWVPLTNGIVPITPIRVVNTATSAGGITGPLVPGATVHTTIDLRTGPIPLEAIGIVGNFAISGVGGAVLNGFGVATIYPAGAATPATANINAGAGCFAISNSVSVGFGTGGNAGKLSIVWNGGVRCPTPRPTSTSPVTSSRPERPALGWGSNPGAAAWLFRGWLEVSSAF